MTVREMIKELKKYRRTNSGIMFICNKYNFYEIETCKPKDFMNSDLFEPVKFVNDEYTNNNGTKGWWLQIFIRKVSEDGVVRQ